MLKAFFIFVMTVLTFTDAKYLRVPNIIIFPALILSCFIGGSFIYASIVTAIGFLFYDRGGIIPTLAGGDIKLLGFVGSVFNLWALVIFLCALGLVFMFRFFRVRAYVGPLPFTPFVFISCIPFLL